MAKDVYFNNVSLLLHGDGVNNGTVITDHSKYAHSAILRGNAKTSTAVTLINGANIALNGVNDYVEFSSAAELCIGGSDFTIEAQLYLTAYAQPVLSTYYYAPIVVKDSAGNREYALSIYGGASSYTNLSFMYAVSDAQTYSIIANYTFALNTKYSIAVSVSGNSIKLYVDNALVATDTLAAPIKTGTSPLLIGKWNFDSSWIPSFLGYIEEVRISKGVARDLTVPQTQAFPDVGYQITINLTETIAATDFVAGVYDLATGQLLNKQTIQAGQTVMDAYTAEPVSVTLAPKQGTVWKPNTVYALNDLVFPTNPSTTPHYYKRINAGTSSATTEPTWPTSGNAQCNDGAVTNAWERVTGLSQPITQSPLIPT